jgi:tRNA(Ile2) C34 agmatinyltransferase TiaS
MPFRLIFGKADTLACATMLERIPRCTYCGREMKRRGLSRTENPRCEICLPERVKRAASRNPVLRWERQGKYFAPVRRVKG